MSQKKSWDKLTLSQKSGKIVNVGVPPSGGWRVSASGTPAVAEVLRLRGHHDRIFTNYATSMCAGPSTFLPPPCWFSLFLVGLLLAGCSSAGGSGSAQPAADGRIEVLATTGMIADAAR